MSEYTLKPGLTGLAQIKDATSHEPERKLQHDIQYVREQSFGYDLMVVVRQIWIVLGELIQVVLEENYEIVKRTIDQARRKELRLIVISAVIFGTVSLGGVPHDASPRLVSPER